jgi:hypothetical protein
MPSLESLLPLPPRVRRYAVPHRSGRQRGYRGFTWKQNVTPGLWRVIAIGIVEFRVAPGGATRTRKVKL